MHHTIAGLIVAGGLSSRMGGGDKSLLELDEKPILDHIISRLQPQVHTLALNANGKASRFAAYGLPILPDTLPDFPGPLAGVLAGLDWMETQTRHQFLATVASDTPFLPHDLVHRLFAAKTDNPQTIILAGSNGRQHPVFALWPAGLSGELRNYLQAGHRKMFDFIAAKPFITVEFAAQNGLDPFFNINTPADLAAALPFIREDRA
ncbi:molybdenum cofactor guanylyltransferase MobA [Aquamicrobium segne]|uniref:Molybdenum cofactor guanylyltransferase n=1 Tax=Aquamicrobium segne TaxID=469547 RepID=A0ABW0GXL8_9HYPH